MLAEPAINALEEVGPGLLRSLLGGAKGGITAVGGAIEEFVTPGRIVAVGAGGTAILVGLGAKNYIQNSQGFQIGPAGWGLTSYGKGSQSNPGSQPSNPLDPSKFFTPQNLAIGGIFAVVVVLGIAYLATRKR